MAEEMLQVTDFIGIWWWGENYHCI